MPERVSTLDEEVSLVNEPVPVMFPEMVWLAELLYCSVPLFVMAPA